MYCLRLRRLVLIFVNPLYQSDSKMPPENSSDGILNRKRLTASIRPAWRRRLQSRQSDGLQRRFPSLLWRQP
ncbi:hypothetical protein E4K46_01960 [Neisseria meningitidis]|nr:hypothetical protein [Neisseria meningitidis]